MVAKLTNPSTIDHQSVHLGYAYPDAERELNRWLPLVKWFLAIPHYEVVIIAWFAILLLIYPVWRSYDHELPIR